MFDLLVGQAGSRLDIVRGVAEIIARIVIEADAQISGVNVAGVHIADVSALNVVGRRPIRWCTTPGVVVLGIGGGVRVLVG
jgi:hypothetical protein